MYHKMETTLTKVKRKTPVCITRKITMALLNDYTLAQDFKCLTGDI